MEELAQTPGFLSLREEIIARARLRPDDPALDLSAGTGRLFAAEARSGAWCRASSAGGAHVMRP